MLMGLTPVTLPPSRARLAISRFPTGSLTAKKTIGMVEVAFFASTAASSPPLAAITSTLRATRSAAKAGNRSYRDSAQRYSIARFCPSTQPVSLSPWRNAAVNGDGAGEPLPR